MSVSGSDSYPGNHNLPPNGRKRKLSNRNSHSSSDSSTSNGSSSSRQSKLNFTPNHKRQRLLLNNSNHSPPLLHHTKSIEEDAECAEMAHQPGTNNRMSFGTNNFVAGKAAVASGTNNHVKKPQSKKLVIKNRKGIKRSTVRDKTELCCWRTPP